VGPSRGSASGLTREVAEQSGAIFFVPSGLFSPFDALFGGGGAPDVDGDAREMARLFTAAVACDRGAVRWQVRAATPKMAARAPSIAG